MPKHATKEQFEEDWYWYLTGENKDGFSHQYESAVKFFRRVSGLIPGTPRCFECNRPLTGIGSLITGARPSTFSPLLCNICEQAAREQEAGAEVELSMLFADIRGSTTLAEQSTPAEFQKLIQRFYHASSEVLVQNYAMVNRLMGDQVIGLFVPRFAGSHHAQVAISAALAMLRATGHESQERPWIPVGIGINTDVAWVGAVGTKEGVNEIAVLGSAANLAARLSSQAAAGEVIISGSTAASAGLATSNLESRQLDLKGISEPVSVRVIRITDSETVLHAGPKSS